MPWTYVPPPPEIVPPKKKRSGWSIAGAILVGLLILGGIGNLADDEPTYTPTGVTSEDPGDTTYEVTAGDVVDVMGQSQVNTFCNAYEVLGDYDLAFAQFVEGYGQSQDPSAEEIFDELLSRC